MRLASWAIAAAASIALPCGGLWAATRAADEAEALEAQLESTHALGARIYAYDRAAWVGTDAMLAQVPRDQLADVRGWVVTEAGGDLLVTFFRGSSDAATRSFEARVHDGAVVETRKFAAPVPLSDGERALVRARDAAWKEAEAREFKPCTPARFNSVVLPAETPGAPVRVYLLSAQVERDSWPMGGHYLVLVDDAGAVRGSRAFMNSCLAMSKKGREKEQGVFFVTHLLDPTPTELHVFTAMASGMSIIVGTPDKRLWTVSREQIRFVTTLAK